jgi:hypothetical protein
MYRLFLIIFTSITLIGFFILMLLYVGSHGHFRFRVHRVEDWFAFGIPAVGLAGLTFILIVKAATHFKRK